MAFINGLFSVLVFLFLILIFLGLIKPSWFKMQSRLKAAGIFFIAMVVSVIVVGATTSEEEKARQTAEREKNQKIEAIDAERKKIDNQQNKQESINTPQPAVIPEVSKEPLKPVANEKINTSLGFTPEQFREKLNDEIIQINADGFKPLKKIKVVDGVFNISGLSGQDLSLVGKVNSQGRIESLNYIFTPVDTQEKLAPIMLYIGLTAKIINPEMVMDKKSPQIINLMTEAAKGIENENNTHTAKVGDVTYSATASKVIGFWFSFNSGN